MKNKFGVIMVIGLGLASQPATLFAHHGNAIYDTEKKTVLKGTVVEWSWANPHCLLTFDVTDDKGVTVHWNGEVSNPPDMVARGWSRKMFKPGDQVEVTMEAAKNGEPIGRMTQVIVNGKTYEGMASQAPKGGDEKK